MPKTTRHVLKADEVALEGPHQLSIDPAATPGGTGTRVAAGAPKAHIVENHADHAVIEVTCPCGRTTQVRCEYTAAAAPSVPQEAGQS